MSFKPEQNSDYTLLLGGRNRHGGSTNPDGLPHMRDLPPVNKAHHSMVDCLAQNGNKVIDIILINMRRTLLQTCREVLELPPLHATFMHKIGSTSFVGRFETDTGWVKNLATINRINDVSVSRVDPMKTTFRVTLRIKDFQIGYDEYRIKAMGVSCSGRLVAAFNDNALHMAVTVGLAQWEPYAQLDDLRLQRMESIYAKMAQA
ncbi:hypothetical protein O3G_MSEX003450 [Manduca sexta]|uniref:Uncharacterized protein n=1 Tax=Manduca sexta TaxID=7130 RepID=A0A921YRH8_MANSE|nr:hypothetical protein O3G_MSEX003450 [Manduca sexta]